MIDIINLSVQFTGNYLFQDVNLKILPTDRIALVGSNGTGKSTLLKIIAKKQTPEDGSIQAKKGLKIGYLPQELISLNNISVFDEVRHSVKILKQIESEDVEIHNKLNDKSISKSEHELFIKKLGDLNNKKEEVGYYSFDAKIEKILMGLGFNESTITKLTSELSGGWQMRVELAKILTADNDIILLDEPTNHLDIDSLQWLVKFLKSFKGAIILVSHDRYFVNNICNKTLEIFNHDVNFYKGNYNDYLKFKEERDERLKSEFLDQQKKIKQTEQFIERFRYKASKAKQVQSRIKQLDKIDKVQLSDSENKIQFKFKNLKPSGVIPLKAFNLSKSYGENSVLNKLNFQIERGEKIALVGPNGAGKTTLAKILSDRLKPTEGNIELGHNTIISFYAQDVVDNLNLKNDIITEVSDSDSEHSTGQLRTILGAFLFHGEDVFKKINILSGGEKSRVALVKVLLTKANTIILDEPTNHLDFDSKKILQNALIEFDGTLIIVSHDIDFLTPIVNKVMEVKNNSISEYYGGIDYYLLKKEENADAPLSMNSNIVKTNKVSRKEEKRIEAEKRRKEFQATKKIKDSLADIELQIEKLEIKKADLENDMTKEEIYSNPDLSKKNKIEYGQVRNKLEELYDTWTDFSEQLENTLQELEN